MIEILQAAIERIRTKPDDSEEARSGGCGFTPQDIADSPQVEIEKR